MANTALIEDIRQAMGGDPVEDYLEPDLVREAGDGIRITCTFFPELDEPESAVVEIYHGRMLLDTLNVPAKEGIVAYRHTTNFSPRYRSLLT